MYQVLIRTKQGDYEMKTQYEEIVDVHSIGGKINPVDINDLLAKSNDERMQPASQDKDRILLLCIDMQNSFMEGGELGVPDSHGDVENLTRWIYGNMEKITQITVSIDTHNPFQVFHRCWWIDEDGNNPPPMTAITMQDLNEGKWKPVVNPIGSINYVENLEKLGKKTLVIWPYHCLQGSFGHALEGQFSNMIYFHSVAKKSIVDRMVKGTDPMTEMYGIFKAEYDPKNRVNIAFLNKIEKFDKVIIAGEAKSHCVYESIKQILDHYQDDIITTKKIYILEDCMSNIPGFEDEMDREFQRFKDDFKVNIVKSTRFTI